MIFKTQGKQYETAITILFECVIASLETDGKESFVSLLFLALSTLAVLTTFSGWVFLV